MADNQERGRDLIAPVKEIMLNGQKRPLVFNNKCFRVAEDVYADFYGVDAGLYKILEDLSRYRLRAIEALYYGAAVAGGLEMTMEEFDAKFRIGDAVEMGNLLGSGIQQAMPEVDGAAEKK